MVAVLRSGWITTGPEVKAFEREFADYRGRRAHAVAVNSCTAALHLGLEARGVGAGDEVLTSTLTFTATAEVAEYLGARARFLDVEPDTLNLSVDALGAGPARVRPAGRCLASPGDRRPAPRHRAGPLRRPALRHAGAPGPRRRVRRCRWSTTPPTRCPAAVGRPARSARWPLPHRLQLLRHQDAHHRRGRDAGHRRRRPRGRGARVMALHGITPGRLEALRQRRQLALRGARRRVQVQPDRHRRRARAGAAPPAARAAGAPGADRGAVRRGVRLARTRSTLPADPAGRQHAWHLYSIRLRLDRLTIDRGAVHRGAAGAADRHQRALHPAPPPAVLRGERYGYRPPRISGRGGGLPALRLAPDLPAMSDEDVERVIAAVLEISACFER